MEGELQKALSFEKEEEERRLQEQRYLESQRQQ
jgi:hypothetical protein